MLMLFIKIFIEGCFNILKFYYEYHGWTFKITMSIENNIVFEFFVELILLTEIISH